MAAMGDSVESSFLIQQYEYYHCQSPAPYPCHYMVMAQEMAGPLSHPPHMHNTFQHHPKGATHPGFQQPPPDNIIPNLQWVAGYTYTMYYTNNSKSSTPNFS